MESEWEKEIRELLDSLERFSIENLMKEIMEAPLPFIDYEPTPKPRRTRKKRVSANCKKCGETRFEVRNLSVSDDSTTFYE
jgi:hypothetical protein